MMKLLDKIMQFDAEAQSADENYKQWGTTREAHQEKMLEFIRRQMDEVRSQKEDVNDEAADGLDA